MNHKENCAVNTKCCDKCFDEGVSQLSYGGCNNSKCDCHIHGPCDCGADKVKEDWNKYTPDFKNGYDKGFAEGRAAGIKEAQDKTCKLCHKFGCDGKIHVQC